RCFLPETSWNDAARSPEEPSSASGAIRTSFGISAGVPGATRMLLQPWRDWIPARDAASATRNVTVSAQGGGGGVLSRDHAASGIIIAAPHRASEETLRTTLHIASLPSRWRSWPTVVSARCP